MLIKLLIWAMVFYFGARALFRWAAGGGKSKEDDSTIKGEPKQREMPYDPNDIVDAHFHDAKESGNGHDKENGKKEEN